MKYILLITIILFFVVVHAVKFDTFVLIFVIVFLYLDNKVLFKNIGNGN